MQKPSEEPEKELENNELLFGRLQAVISPDLVNDNEMDELDHGANPADKLNYSIPLGDEENEMT